MTQHNVKRKWLTYSISGLLLIGFGLSLFGEAIAIKMTENTNDSWFWWGTFSLVIFNSGLCLFGQAVIYRTSLNKKGA